MNRVTLPRANSSGHGDALRWKPFSFSKGSHENEIPDPKNFGRKQSLRRSLRVSCSGQNESGSSVDPKLDLLFALTAAISKQQEKSLGGISISINGVFERLRKVLQPLPQWFPPGPLGDSAISMATNPLEFLKSLQEYGKASGIKLAGEGVIVISDPKLAREVLATKSNIFVKAGTAFFPGSSLAGNGLLVSDGETWKRQRRLSNPAFRKTAIETYSNEMTLLSKWMVDSWLKSKPSSNSRPMRNVVVRDIYGDFNNLTMMIVSRALFGGSDAMENGSEEIGSAISTAFSFFAKRATTMMIIPEWVPTAENIQYNHAVSKLDKLVYKLIKDRRQELQSESKGPANQRKDLLTRLLQARDEDGSGMDDVALRDELMTLLVAGQETSSILLSWTCVMIALHPGVKQRLVSEIDQALEGRLPTHKDMEKLKYLEAIIWETMRLLPPAYIIGRCANADTVIGDSYRVPAGTTVLVALYSLHRDPKHWLRASEFDPSRWLPGGGAEGHVENDSYWPFGGGQRNCIGMGFAMMEVSLVLATIFQSCDLSFPPNSKPPEPQAMITLRPEGKVDMVIQARRQKKTRNVHKQAEEGLKKQSKQASMPLSTTCPESQPAAESELEFVTH